MAKKITESILNDMVDYYTNNNVTLQELGNKFNVTKETAWRHMKNAGVIIDAQRTKRGKKAWNSGLSKHSDNRVAKYAKTKSKDYILDGYRMTWSDELNKSVREHHKVWFEKHGLWPDSSKGEQIHHIDGDKLNNDISNLVLCDVSEHTKIHKQYEELVFKLIKENLVYFDKQSNTLDAQCLMGLLEDAGWLLKEKL